MRSPRLPIPGVAVLLPVVLAGLVFGQGTIPSQRRQYRAAPRVQQVFRSRAPRAEVDLRPEIQKLGLAIRDQGNRGTCSVFATTFLIEYHMAHGTGLTGIDLSEEYLNWAKNEANHEDKDGGFFTEIIKGYQEFGMVPVTDMPNKPAFHPKHPDTPSKAVIAAGKSEPRFPFSFIKNWDNQKGMTEAELEAAKRALKAGRPVATGIWWLTNFETVTVDGIPLLKEYPRKDNTGSNPPMYDGHSIDLVGYHVGKNFPGGGYFVFRNSFGTGFGEDGYGFLSFQYLRDYSNDAIVIEKKE